MSDKRFVAFLATLLLIAPTAQAEEPADPAREAELLELVIEFSDLIDPESVRFRKVRHTRLSYDAWCGEFNAKNRMGGYVGWAKFAARDRRRGGSPQNPSRYVQFITTEVLSACQRDRTYVRDDWSGFRQIFNGGQSR